MRHRKQIIVWLVYDSSTNDEVIAVFTTRWRADRFCQHCAGTYWKKWVTDEWPKHGNKE